MTLTALKNSNIEQLNNEIFALLSTRFSYLKINHLIKRIGITYVTQACNSYPFKCNFCPP
ncbi:hypothetical protein EU508_13880 [Pseudoalteromonas fuliginea]|uniref:Radical SAM protein n=1 Tax=Pseudoalteromonas fuliginea TaxID=1872678 RepID=A0AB73BEZ6_9GAMM|nr:hypothetical protein EU508_13880 [Pseudoalteromonas fuliginea]